MRGKTDILIAGGGIAGLCAAAGFGAAGYSVLLVTPDHPERDAPNDLRTTAYLQPSKDLLERIGVWPSLKAQATPLDALRIVDTTGAPAEMRDSRTFTASELGHGSFGWNVLNAQMRATLVRHVKTMNRVELRFGTGFQSMTQRDAHVLARLSDGTTIEAKLVIGCDGRNSPVRDAAGISVRTTRYGQKALAFAVNHPEPHGNVSTEIYNAGGPFTMVPRADVDGIPASAIVWMNPGPEAVGFAKMDVPGFEKAISERCCYMHGPLTLLGDRQIWPIVTQTAEALTSQRVALAAEAAHVMPPIGAQGLNTSLADIASLLDTVKTHPEDPGAEAVLSAYSKARKHDIQARTTAIDLFNRVTRSGLPFVQSLRLAGLKAAYDIAPVRHTLMKAGLNAR